MITESVVSLDAKQAVLDELLRSTGGLAIAFSGGVDSSFLVAAAHAVLGDRALAVTARSPLYTQSECRQAVDLAHRLGIRHCLIDSDELQVPGFAENPSNRCYLCKHQLFMEVKREALRHGLVCVADGTNADDVADYRPGRRAAREAGVLSPLMQAGLTKEDIRCLSRRMGLPTADKPAMACLASRFPYGTRITEAALGAVEAVEESLRAAGIRCCRVRFHDTICRIELGDEDLANFVGSAACTAAVAAARTAGFTYVTLDLQGYRTGSMNEVLTDAQKSAF